VADRKGLSASVALGTLLIPLTAFAASVMVGDGTAADPATTVTSTIVETKVGPVFTSQTATAADLVAACGEAGLDLVDSEAEGSITDIQQAALDALREICAQQGMPLPGKPVPEPIVETVVANAASGPSVSPPLFETEREYEAENEDEDGEYEVGELEGEEDD